MSFETETKRRRTFAIISHPDAGKTTLTEKLLLYGGAVHLAGSVTARRNQRATSSDWMELEKKRGISINSTLLQFEYGGFCINLLDTPGHRDFSEDTYRVLTAVDAIVMVIDAGKDVDFRGVFDRRSKQVHFAWIHSARTAQIKRFREGLDQLLQEGVVQSFLLRHATRRVPLLAAVGPLQFEVVQCRLQTEYSAESRLESAPWKLLRWVTSGNFEEADLPSGARTAADAAGQEVILFPEEWARGFFAEHHPEVGLSTLPPATRREQLA